MVKPPAEPICSGQAQLHGPGVRVVRGHGGKALRNSELPVALRDGLAGAIKVLAEVFNSGQQGARGNRHVKIDVVEAINRRRKEILLDVGGAQARARFQPDWPTIGCAALDDRRALDALVHGTNELGQGAAAGVACAAYSLGVDVRARLQVIDGPHSIPNEVLGQGFAEQ